MSTYQNGFSALADPTRRAIFEQLAHGPRPVGELAERFPVSRPAVSQHLRVLKDAGLVADRRDGSRRLYSVDRRGVAAMRAYLDSSGPKRSPPSSEAARAEGSNMTEQATTGVQQSVTVPLAPDKAFELFVDEFESGGPARAPTA